MSAFREPQLARTNRWFLIIGLLALLTLGGYAYWDYQNRNQQREAVDIQPGETVP
ncbi:MAG: hypothetical protein OHK005_17370 [Candidatus Methylacidiphilales bacterium]